MQLTEKTEFQLNLNEDEAKQLLQEIADVDYENRGNLLNKLSDLLWNKLDNM